MFLFREVVFAGGYKCKSQRFGSVRWSFVLKVSFFSDEDKITETFDINISPSDKEQYVLLPSSETAARIDLYAEFKNAEPRCLAKSGLISMPKGCPELSLSAIDSDVPEIMMRYTSLQNK